MWTQEVDIDLELAGDEFSYSGKSDTGFQVLAGVNYLLNKDWIIQFEARHTSITDISLSAEQQALAIDKIRGLDYQPTTLQLGIVYRF